MYLSVYIHNIGTCMYVVHVPSCKPSVQSVLKLEDSKIGTIILICTCITTDTSILGSIPISKHQLERAEVYRPVQNQASHTDAYATH